MCTYGKNAKLFIRLCQRKKLLKEYKERRFGENDPDEHELKLSSLPPRRDMRPASSFSPPPPYATILQPTLSTLLSPLLSLSSPSSPGQLAPRTLEPLPKKAGQSTATSTAAPRPLSYPRQHPQIHACHPYTAIAIAA